MIKQRPLLRFDGFYICKMMYRRQGLNINSLNAPVHEVVWYRYIRFRADRSAVSLYTTAVPKRFLPKYTQSLKLQAQYGGGVSQEEEKQQLSSIAESAMEPTVPGMPSNAP